MLSKHSGAQTFPLTTGATDNPSLTVSQETQFQLSGLPEVQGNLVWKLLGIMLTLTGNLVQSGGTGVRLTELDLYRAIIANMRVSQGFFGNPIRTPHFIGAWLPSIEFINNGYEYAAPKRSVFPAANATYPYSIDIFVPISYWGANADDHHTAQCSSFYQQAIFALTPAAASVLTAMSPGATLTSQACKASAVMLLDREIMLPPGFEWVGYQTPYASGSITNFLNMGSDTGFDGVMPGAGFLDAALLTSARGQGGAFAGNALTAIGAPFRSQMRTTHVEAPQNLAWAAQAPGRPQGSSFDAATTGAPTDYAASPHLYTQTSAAGVATDPTGSVVNASLLRVSIGCNAGRFLNLSNVQHVEGNLPINVEVSSGSGQQVLLVAQAKAWQQTKKIAALQYLLGRGVPQAVMGVKGGYQWQPKVSHFQQGFGRPSEARYLPDVLRAA